MFRLQRLQEMLLDQIFFFVQKRHGLNGLRSEWMFLFRLHQNLRHRNQVLRPNTVSPQLLILVSHELCDVVLVSCAAPLGTAAVVSRRVQLIELKHRSEFHSAFTVHLIFLEPSLR